MKTCLRALGVFAASLFTAAAQSDLPAVRLAIVAENTAANAAADVLTAELTTNASVVLLERIEIEKIYREQRLTADNQDYKKLGELLGADGLLMLDTATEGTNQFLKAQLVAVKPGVIISESRAAWPLSDVARWATLAARRFEPLFPKLSVLEKDALPVSVVNLRAALKSDDEQGLESSLTLMLISRLTYERDLFVLERRRLDSLGTEKSLNGAQDSPFWNGAYLVDGIVDRDGFSKETVTISGRLIPPKGGTPVVLEASGARANPAAVIDELANKIVGALKIAPTGTAWQASDESARYFQEAQWEFSWGMFEEARADADSAWALGKKDMDCAILRISALVNPPYEFPVVTIGRIEPGIDIDGSESARDAQVRYIRKVAADSPGTVFELTHRAISYLEVRTRPKEEQLNRMEHGLELFREFSLSLVPGPKTVSADWRNTGVKALAQAARTLQYYYFFPRESEPVKEKLADLRASARAVAEWLLQCVPPGRSQISDDEVLWGSYWRESPEDCVTMYRALLSIPNGSLSPSSKGQPGSFIDPPPELSWPWLTAWNDADRRRIPMVWESFLQELAGSTNHAFRAAAKALVRTPPSNFNSQEMAEEYLRYWQDFKSHKLDSQEFEYARKILTETNLSDPADFSIFYERPYTQSEAAVLQPLLTAYQSNYSAQFGNAYDSDGSILQHLATLRDLQSKLGSVLQPEQVESPRPRPPTARPDVLTASNWLPSVKPLFVNHFDKLPVDRVPIKSQWPLYFSDFAGEPGQLALDLADDVNWAAALFDTSKENWRFFKFPQDRQPLSFEAFALLQSSVYYSEDDMFAEGPNGSPVILPPVIKRLNTRNGTWESLNVPGVNHSLLFSANGRLFATSKENILELTNGGKDVRVLASTRRRPPASTLDSMTELGVNAPGIFAGPDQTLNAILTVPTGTSGFYTPRSKVFVWESNDWREAFVLNDAVDRRVCDGLVVFRSRGLLWCWGHGQVRPELCLDERTPSPAGKTIWKANTNLSLTTAPMVCFKTNLYFFFEHDTPLAIDPHWTEQEKNVGPPALAGARRSWSVSERDGCHALLVCLEWDCPDPIIVPLKFDLTQGPPPLSLGGLPKGADSSVRLFIGNNNLYICHPTCLGIWIVPMAEVDAAVAKQKLTLAGKNSERADMGK